MKKIVTTGKYCPHCGGLVKPFGRKEYAQYRCVENPEHYCSWETVYNKRSVILDE